MTIEKIKDAIKHINKIIYDNDTCAECKKEHEELKEMLEELIKYKSNKYECISKSFILTIKLKAGQYQAIIASADELKKELKSIKYEKHETSIGLNFTELLINKITDEVRQGKSFDYTIVNDSDIFRLAIDGDDEPETLTGNDYFKRAEYAEQWFVFLKALYDKFGQNQGCMSVKMYGDVAAHIAWSWVRKKTVINDKEEIYKWERTK